MQVIGDRQIVVAREFPNYFVLLNHKNIQPQKLLKQQVARKE